MIKRTSEVASQLCDILAAQAMQNLPTSAQTMLRVCQLLRFIAADCAAMEQRLTGSSSDDFDGENVIRLRPVKLAGDA